MRRRLGVMKEGKVGEEEALRSNFFLFLVSRQNEGHQIK